MRAGPAALLCSGLLLVASSAHANGAFPSSGQVLVDPTDPSTIWVRTSYGFAKSSDAGATFHLICEEAIGYSSGYHPHAALSHTGAIFMGLSDGLAIGRGDTCAFDRAPDLEGNFVVDVSMGLDGRAIALAIPPNGERPRVYASTDDLATWSQLGDVLPDKVVPLTLDAAPSDPNVIYVSAYAEGDKPLGLVITSTDGGQTWTSAIVPNSDAKVSPFIGGIDPLAPERLFVRINSVPGRLLLSEDYGATFEVVASLANGRLHAFRLSDDGAYALYGGNFDGLHELDTTTFATEPRAAIAARCVTFADGRIFACGEEATDGFTAGVSEDGAATFTPLLENRCIEGILPCASGAPVHDLCEPGWPMIKELIGATGDCDASGGGSQGGAPATGGQSQGGAPAATGGASNAGGGGAGGSGGAPADGDGGGCACTLAPGAPTSEWSSAIAALAAIALLGHRKNNARHAPQTTSRSHHGCRRRSRACAGLASRGARRSTRPL
ncbi:MAG: exo-alpha-sialidase [Polyangiaceae bacterium]|nr:exo-alpha-sialidase [Polyangiaceae bacterium]